MSYLIGFRRAWISVFTLLIRSSTSRIRNGILTRTGNSRKSQFLSMISSISSHLSLSQPSPNNTKLSYSYLSLHSMIMSWHRVQHTQSTVYTECCIHRVLHTLSIAHTKYCIMPRPSVSRSQPVSQLSADLIVHKNLHSHNYKLTNELSYSCRRTSLLIFCLQMD